MDLAEPGLSRDEADTFEAVMGWPKREPDASGGRGEVSWWLWVGSDIGRAVCYWCLGSVPATGLVLTDAAGPRQWSMLGVCGDHHPHGWMSRHWRELRATYREGHATYQRRASWHD
jgi:hypothetical protein